jgi:hypothetical protein
VDGKTDMQERRPNILMLGCRSLLGASKFLHGAGAGNIQYVARTPVQVLVLHKGEKALARQTSSDNLHKTQDSIRTAIFRTASGQQSQDSNLHKTQDSKPMRERFDETKVIGLSLSDIEIQNVPPAQLAEIYHGLALSLAPTVRQVRLEAVR